MCGSVWWHEPASHRRGVDRAELPVNRSLRRADSLLYVNLLRKRPAGSVLAGPIEATMWTPRTTSRSIQSCSSHQDPPFRNAGVRKEARVSCPKFLGGP